MRLLQKLFVTIFRTYLLSQNHSLKWSSLRPQKLKLVPLSLLSLFLSIPVYPGAPIEPKILCTNYFPNHFIVFSVIIVYKARYAIYLYYIYTYVYIYICAYLHMYVFVSKFVCVHIGIFIYTNHTYKNRYVCISFE